MSQEPTHQLQRAIISEQLGLTNYQLNKYLVTMNADLATVSEERPSFIDEVTKGIWTGHNITTFITQKIALLYLNRSNLFPAFEYRAFYDNSDIKANVYATEHFQTESTFYKNDRKLKKTLAANNFDSISGVNQEHEFIMRLRLFQLYYTTFTGIERPLPALNELSDQLCSQLQKLFPAELSPTQSVKLETLLKIWILRQRNHSLIETATLTEPLRDGTYQAVAAVLTQGLGPDLTPSTAEIDYVFSFLLTQGFLGLDDVTYVEQNFPIATTLSTEFLTQLTEKAVLTEDTDLASTGLYEQLLAVNLQFTTFYVEPTTFISSDQVSFFKDLYPTFDLIIRDFLSAVKNLVSFDLSDHMIVNLYFSYMFCMINSIPTSNTKDRIFVCVDFSEGPLYTNYVIQSLQAFNHAHIVIQRQLTDQTDIYISDFHSMLVTVPQVIWLDPPTAQDWSGLADIILNIKQTRLQHLFPDYDWSD
ncbi:hypothetical protein FC96_GL000912 [Secundilactobacillus kimchicus JCM 15530]|uniref:Mga helix-turn-helix domain-containing protein n=1 Tax=Secundilactobacillus kimchicus JCM 15530 TaxID=1302272 RepID=A0A0R1HSZ2_9LACO|nr:hypothetical protein FC96_GL000912 [Secundilactobacillus kimchicus JCM 15530]